MRSALLLLTGQLFFCFLVQAQNYPANRYQLIPSFSDEFTSKTLNTNLWNDYSGQSFYQERVHFVSSCVSVGNSSPADPANASGFLRITPYVIAMPDTVGAHKGEIRFDSTYYSGCLQSTRYFRYGYYETRVKMPPQPLNVTSSWWAYGGCVAPWPNALYNEFDIFETALTNDPKGGVLHGTSNCSYESNYNAEYKPGYTGSRMTADLTTAFHTFGFEWMPEYVNIFIDGNLYRHITDMGFSKDGAEGKLYGDETPTKVLSTPALFRFWIKRDNRNDKYPNGARYMEADYFRYYKARPCVRSGSYSSSGNSLVLSATSPEPTDAFVWNVSSGNIILSTQSNGFVAFSLSPGFITSTVSVSASGLRPQATSSATFAITKSNGSFCSLSGIGNTPIIYLAPTFVAPQAGCAATVVEASMNVTFISESDILLNPGFEVQAGGEFSTFK